MEKRFSQAYLDFKNKSLELYNKIQEKLHKLEEIKFRVSSVEFSLANIIIILIIIGILTLSNTKLQSYLFKNENKAGEVSSQVSSMRIESPPQSSASGSVVQQNPSPLAAPSPTPAPEPPPVNFQPLPAYLSNVPLVKELPSNAVISLKFFTFVAGQRIWQNEYIIKKASVIEGKADKPDVIMILHSKYVDRLYNEDFCKVIQDAKKNGDVAFDTQLSAIAIVWKFKSLMKYKSCIS